MYITVRKAFEKVVLKYPNKTALCFEDGKKITFSELYKKAKKISYLIKSSSIEPRSVIAIYMNRSDKMLAILLGILLAECVYLPIDTRNPKARVLYYLSNAPVVGIFLEEDLMQDDYFFKKFHKIEESETKFLVINLITRPYQNIDNDSLYVMYTSGSTGKSKAVIGTNSGLINRLDWTYKTYPINDEEKFVLNSSFSFVDSVVEIFLPILNGSVLYIPTESITSNPIELLEYIYRNKITRLVTGSAILLAILDYGEKLEEKLNSIKVLTLSGQELQLSLVKKFRKLFPEITLLNLYGSTEVSADALYYEIPKGNCKNLDVIPIGKPISNIRACILDEQGNLIKSRNVEGEICISGIGVATGYLYDSKSSISFIKCPITKSERAYRMGDIGYIDYKGNFIYIGRIDGQYKINGQKINRNEVEKLALELPEVSLAALVMNDSKLELYIKPSKQYFNQNFKHIIIEHLKQHIPLYMIPNEIITLDKMPLNNNGKIDYLTLENNVKYDKSSVVLSDIHESFFVHFFQKMFKLSYIPSVNSSFFGLGGNSLLAYILISKIKQEFGTIVNLIDIYEYQTPKCLATLIKRKSFSCKRNSSVILNSVLNDSNTENIFILFPSILGNHGNYSDFIKRFTNVRFYQISYDYNSKKMYKNMQELSKLYADWIVSNIDKIHKIYLLGWSFGGTLAYATSCHLLKRAFKITGLVMLDSFNPKLFNFESEKDDKQELYNIILKSYEQNTEKLYLDHFHEILEHNIQILWKFDPKYVINCPSLLLKASTYNSKVNSLVKEKFNGWERVIISDVLKVRKMNVDHFHIQSDICSKDLYQIIADELKL